MDEEVNYSAPHTMVDVESNLQHIKYWEEQLEQRRKHANKEIEKAKTWLALQEERIESKLSWHRESIRQHMEKDGVKSASFINGRVAWHKGRERVEVLDEEKFLTWVRVRGKDDLTNTKTITTPNKNEIRDFVRISGELPDGIDLIVGEDQLVIKAGGIDMPEKEESPPVNVGKDLEFV